MNYAMPSGAVLLAHGPLSCPARYLRDEVPTRRDVVARRLLDRSHATLTRRLEKVKDSPDPVSCAEANDLRFLLAAVIRVKNLLCGKDEK